LCDLQIFLPQKAQKEHRNFIPICVFCGLCGRDYSLGLFRGLDLIFLNPVDFLSRPTQYQIKTVTNRRPWSIVHRPSVVPAGIRMYHPAHPQQPKVPLAPVSIVRTASPFGPELICNMSFVPTFPCAIAPIMQYIPRITSIESGMDECAPSRAAPRIATPKNRAPC
jgi:hypothetical protein